MMSIRLRFTLLYNAILAVTLLIFGVALYSALAQSTLEALKKDLVHSSAGLADSLTRSAANPNQAPSHPPNDNKPPPKPFENFSGDPSFQSLPEREIVRVLDATGSLVASPLGRSEDALPLSGAGLKALQAGQEWWESRNVQEQPMLIYNHPVEAGGKLAYILQIARPLSERNSSLQSLGRTLILASIVILLAAFGIGWLLSGITLRPIQRLTQTARAIGEERDFSRRVDYRGPPDEVGQLANTFNAMLGGLQEAYQRVEGSLEMQRTFVADVSHELRTPLTTLRGNLGLLRRTPPIPAEEQSDILNDMVEESDRLIRLVNDLLLLARADAGRSLVIQPVEVSPVLEETCRQVEQLDPERQIDLMVPSGLSIMGDRDALKQVALIALDNALKHCDGEISVSAKRTEAQIEIRVQDCGEGIPSEKLEHIFDRFYRGDEVAAIPGTGLGLAIARSLVVSQNGTITMESEVGKGSVLILGFPAADANGG
jgi:two-component system, OmpR family, sensor kinase